ncbi:Hypp9545 [Branchiostoma lanceolatum]|uniref:Hypp9545 protein n=1 Tax=Branchiostoma lanceolatum TaxID=7740 RepID=A0A8S4MMZ5_BRALA|nr:Hypp9545 [Branchiostoma lanceolatum]
MDSQYEDLSESEHIGEIYRPSVIAYLALYFILRKTNTCLLDVIPNINVLFLACFSVDSPTNDRMIKTLRSEIVKDHGGEEKCPFSPKEMRDAARRYYRSKKDDRVRREKGKLPAHREKIRKRQRLVQKVERRGRALEKVRDSDSPTWTERHKKRAAEMLDRAYMSSESSGDEDQGGFIVRQLAWESSSLRKLKDSLDKVCPPRGVARVPSAEVSDRQAPEGAPAWAIKRHMRQGERGPSQLDDSLTE